MKIIYMVLILLISLYINGELLYGNNQNENIVILSLATNETIATGIIQLKSSIPDDIPFIVMVPYSMTETNIRWQRRIASMNNTHVHSLSEHILDHVPAINDPYLREKGFRSTWYKLAIWSVTNYNIGMDKKIEIDKIVYLDADTMITGQFENIMDYFSSLDHTAMAYDTIPPGWFNTGVLVTRPSVEKFKIISSQVSMIGSVDGSDQGFLNELYQTYPDIVQWNTRLNFSYNAFSWVKHIEPNIWNYFEPIQIVHFNTLTDKPYGKNAQKEKDLNANTPFIKSHKELVDLWKIWRYNYCKQIKKFDNPIDNDVLHYCNIN